MMDLAGFGTILATVALACGAELGLLAFALLYWTARDIAARTRSWTVRLAAMALVVLFNVVGLLVYVLLRPRLTLSERQEREIIEELLAREVTAATLPRGPAGDSAGQGTGTAPDHAAATSRPPTIVGPPPR